jgi:hypothetical protein
MTEDVSRETPSFRLAFVRSGPPRGPEEVAQDIARTAVEMFSRPSFRAGVVSSAVVGTLCMRAGMRPLPALALMMVAHSAGERLFQMAEDIHGTVMEQDGARRMPDAPSPL